MHIEYENVWKKYKKDTVRKLVNRGFEEIEAISTIEILENLMTVRVPDIQLEVLNDVLKRGDMRQDYYATIKSMMKELEQQKDQKCQKSDHLKL